MARYRIELRLDNITGCTPSLMALTLFTYKPLLSLFTRPPHRHYFHAPPRSSAMEPPAATPNADPFVQYVVLRRDLIDTWPLGSVVTQGCHASVAAVWAHKDDPHTLQYCSHLDSMHKVTLEVKGEAQIVTLTEKLKEGGIDHKLWIEQPENIPTCLATKPYPKSIVSSYFRRLKLCK